MEQGHSVLPSKVWTDLFLIAFHGRLGDFLLGREGGYLWGTVLHGGLMIRSSHRQGSFTNAFCSNLKTINLKIFANHEGIYT